MLKGLVITPPVLGRISIGKVVERNGKRLPEKDDQFTITSQVQNREGWINRPFDEVLRAAQGGKIRSIPIRLMFDALELNFRAQYTLFDRETGRPVCSGNGETCKRQTNEGIQTLPCPTSDACALAVTGSSKACKPYGRLNVLIELEENSKNAESLENAEDAQNHDRQSSNEQSAKVKTSPTLLDPVDPIGSFIFRTTGYNSIRTLTARLQYFAALSQNHLSCMPLELRLRGKSTRQSHGTPIYYVDITIRSGLSLEQALELTFKAYQQRKEAGLDQVALDEAAQLGFRNGEFEDTEEDAGEVVEEFYSTPA